MSILLAACLLPMHLVFDDEFNAGTKPNPQLWSYEQGFVRNREAQWYQPQNATIRDGCLLILAKREQAINPNYDPASNDWKKNRKAADYTSASVTTKGRESWLYGRFEIRARFNPTDGLWPAIWSVGVKGPWPSNGEIDIMEYYQRTLLANTAYGQKAAIWDSVKKPIQQFLDRDPNWGSKFHVWRMDWDASMIRLYVDNYLMNATDITTTVYPNGVNPFHQPQSLILNLAIGSTGGDPSKTPMPAKFEIDYVRIWQ